MRLFSVFFGHNKQRSMSRMIYTHVFLKPANLLQAGIQSEELSQSVGNCFFFFTPLSHLFVVSPQFKSERLEPAVNAAMANLITKNCHLANRLAVVRTSRVPTPAGPHLKS